MNFAMMVSFVVTSYEITRFVFGVNSYKKFHESMLVRTSFFGGCCRSGSKVWHYLGCIAIKTTQTWLIITFIPILYKMFDEVYVLMLLSMLGSIRHCVFT
jgi:hypothetical protein